MAQPSADVYKIRPAGRHLITIGRDLIQNSFAAVLELVKNSFDADSSQVDVIFKLEREDNSSFSQLSEAQNATSPPFLSKLAIVISDNGYGMSRDVVVNKWLVPSTKDKLIRGKSPNGRIMQGKKGI